MATISFIPAPDWGDCPRNKLNTLTTEHALAILCMLRSPHRVSEQLRHCLLILRGLKSEEHLCTRAMVTAAELYTVVDKLLAKEIQSGVAALLPFWGNKDPWATATWQEHQQLHISIAHLLCLHRSGRAESKALTTPAALTALLSHSQQP